MRSILQDEPVPLNDALGGCPYQLVTISRRALAKNEANRYQSMEQLLLDLKSAWASMHLNSSGEPAPAVGVQAAERAFAMQEASVGKPQISQSVQRLERRELPAKDARPSGSGRRAQSGRRSGHADPGICAGAGYSERECELSEPLVVRAWLGGRIMAEGNRYLRGRIGYRHHRPRSQPPLASFLRERASFGRIRSGDGGVEASPGGFIAVCFIKDRLVGERARERAFRRRESDTRGAIRSCRGRVQPGRRGQGCCRTEITCLAAVSADRAGSRSSSQGRGGIRLLNNPQGIAQRYALAGDRMRRRCAQSGKRPGRRRSGRPLRRLRGTDRPTRSGFSSPGQSFRRRAARRVWATAWPCSR